MPPPRRHLLLQLKEIDGGKFEKVMPMITVLEMIEVTWKFKVAKAQEKIFELVETTWAIYSTGIFDINQVCPKKHDPNLTHQIQWHHFHRQGLLHPHHGSRDLGRQIWNNGNPDENHGLGWKTDRPVQTSKHHNQTKRSWDWGQNTMMSLTPANCSMSWTRLNWLRLTGRSPHQKPWSESRWPYSALASWSTRNKTTNLRNHPYPLYQPHQCQCQWPTPGLPIRPQSQMRPSQSASAVHKGKNQEKGRGIQQYLKR